MLAVIGYLLIVFGSGPGGAGAVMLELVLQSIPIVFLTRRSVKATFA
ncbi:MAG: hypothetical protein ABR946_02085 [Solirubrobacteraceae bacterium]